VFNASSYASILVGLQESGISNNSTDDHPSAPLGRDRLDLTDSTVRPMTVPMRYRQVS
jgi:hypothetical protein